MKRLIQTFTLVGVLTLVGAAQTHAFTDNFNGGTDTGWTHYAPISGSSFTFPTAWGSVGY